MTRFQDFKYARSKLTEYGLQYIENLKTPEAWLRFAKYHPPKYIRRRLLDYGSDISYQDGWENFVFRIKNNLTRNEYIGSRSGLNSKSRNEVFYFVTLYKKNRAATNIPSMEKTHQFS